MMTNFSKKNESTKKLSKKDESIKKLSKENKTTKNFCKENESIKKLPKKEELTKRLSKIANFVTSKYIVDVGTDHGLLPKFLLKNNVANFAVVSDISKKCVLKAKNNLSDFEDKCFFICANGVDFCGEESFLKQVKNKSDFFRNAQVVIAGMGGNEIKNILNSEKNKFQKFILQPQKNVVELRKFLINSGYNIKQDILVKEGKMFYNVLNIVRSNLKQSLNDFELFFGLTNLKTENKDFEEYLSFRKERLEEILKIKEVENLRFELELIKRVNIGGLNV